MVIRPRPQSTRVMAMLQGLISPAAGGGRAAASSRSRSSKRRSSVIEITSQLLAQGLPQAIQAALHGPFRQAQLGGHLGGGLAVVILPVEQLPLVHRQARDSRPQLRLPLAAEHLVLGAAVPVGHGVLQRGVLRSLGAGAVQGGVAGQGGQPAVQAALCPVEAPRPLPDAQGYVRQALLPVPLIREDGTQDIEEQRRETPQQRLQGCLVTAGDARHQLSATAMGAEKPPTWPADYARRRLWARSSDRGSIPRDSTKTSVVSVRERRFFVATVGSHESCSATSI